MKLSKTLSIVAVGLASVALLAACSSNANSSKSSSSKQTSIVVASDGSTSPFEYTDKSGKLTGYDVAVAKAVFAKLPQYKVTYKVVDFSSIAQGISDGRFQMGANDFGWTAQRAQSYNFSYPISKSNDAVLVKSSAPTYKTLSDLAGKSTIGNPASNYTQVIQSFNTANPSKKINLSYSSDQTSPSTRAQQVDSGKIDFMLYDKISLTTIKEQNALDNLKVESITDSNDSGSHAGYEYYLFGQDKTGTQLQKDVNKELAALQKDGTLSKLSKQYFGGDFVPTADKFKD